MVFLIAYLVENIIETYYPTIWNPTNEAKVVYGVIIPRTVMKHLKLV